MKDRSCFKWNSVYFSFFPHLYRAS